MFLQIYVTSFLRVDSLLVVVPFFATEPVFWHVFFWGGSLIPNHTAGGPVKVDGGHSDCGLGLRLGTKLAGFC